MPEGNVNGASPETRVTMYQIYTSLHQSNDCIFIRRSAGTIAASPLLIYGEFNGYLHCRLRHRLFYAHTT